MPEAQALIRTPAEACSPTYNRSAEHEPEVRPSVPILRDVSRYVREHWVRFLATSLVLLVPCFWHREIIAGDLGSHLYNAWLVQLIRHGQAPGLWLAPQRTNVLFDYLLAGLGPLIGLHAAEKIAVSIAVLIFFWGVFALVSAATRRAPWVLLPCIAAIGYGWTFHMGFFNYYLALGLAFFSMAIFWRGRGWEKAIALAIVPLAWLAHGLGVIWLAGAWAYVAIAKASPRRYHFVLFVAAVTSLFAVKYFLARHYEIDPGTRPFYLFNGADQLWLYSGRYRIPALALVVLAIVSIAVDVIRRRAERGLWACYSLPVQLYALAIVSVFVLPDGVHLSPVTAPIALLTERMTTVSATLACCVLGVMRPSKWHFAASAAIAVVFFFFVYQDTAQFDRMEQQIVRLVSTLPLDQRVVGTIEAPPDSRVWIQHILDRACIGRCFSYGNYEPSSNDFWVRARPGNAYVLSDYDLATSTEEGEYTVQPEDLPLHQIYQCDLSGDRICMRPLEAGEENDRLGVHPPE